MTVNRLAIPADFGLNGEYLHRHRFITDDLLNGQHAIRAWEYSQALTAFEQWLGSRWKKSTMRRRPPAPSLVDVGGAGSQFWTTLSHYTSPNLVARIDPALDANQTSPIAWTLSLGAFRTRYPDASFDVVFCLSVLEHIPNDDTEAHSHFLHDLTALVRPGGLLVLTVDAAESTDDRYHFHWMRDHIYDSEALDALGSALRRQGFTLLDTPKWDYSGPTLYDYTVAALAAVKQS